MQKRVLIIEDDAFMRDMLMIIVEDGGYSTVGAEDGKQALALLAADTDFAAVISDLYLPDLQGFELLAKISDILPHTPFVILSGEEDPNVVEQARAAGIMYLIKDMQLAEILNDKLAQLLQEDC